MDKKKKAQLQRTIRFMEANAEQAKQLLQGEVLDDGQDWYWQFDNMLTKLATIRTELIEAAN